MPARQLGRVSSHGGGPSSAGRMVASMIATPPTKRSHLALKATTARAGRGELRGPKFETMMRPGTVYQAIICVEAW